MSTTLNRRVAAQGIGDKAVQRMSTSSPQLLSELATLQAARSFFRTWSQLAQTRRSGGTKPHHVFVIHP